MSQGHAAGLQDFFDSLAHTRRVAEEAQRRLDLYLATGFSLFNFYRPDENAFSNILADLLNPDGSHGQGARFLEAFLQVLNSDRLPGDGRCRAVVREQLSPWAGRARRIDLCLWFDRPGEHVLAIENKHWATDRDEQVSDYIAWLEASHGDRWTFVYLSPSGRDPCSLGPERCAQLKRMKRLIPLSYCSTGDETTLSIEAWCQRCLEVAEAPRVQSFLRDLIAYIGMALPVHQTAST